MARAQSSGESIDPDDPNAEEAAPPARRAAPDARAARSSQAPQASSVMLSRPETRGTLNERLKGAILDARPKIGKLEPWQEKILQDEILTQPQRFVKDYTGSTAVVDIETIRNYLRYRAEPSASGASRALPKLLVLLRVEPGCSKCRQDAEAVRRLMIARAERRGLSLSWQSGDDLLQGKISDAELDQKLIQLAEAQNAAGVLSMKLAPVASDDIESVHADEKHYNVRDFVYLRDSAGKELARTDGKLEVFDTETLDGPASRLLTDAFSDIGARLGKLAQEAQTAGRTEVLIAVQGVRDYGAFKDARDGLSQRLQDAGDLEEHEISRGRVVFALQTDRTPEQVRSQLVGMRIGTMSAAVHDGVSGNLIEMELR